MASEVSGLGTGTFACGGARFDMAVGKGGGGSKNKHINSRILDDFSSGEQAGESTSKTRAREMIVCQIGDSAEFGLCLSCTAFNGVDWLGVDNFALTSDSWRPLFSGFYPFVFLLVGTAGVASSQRMEPLGLQL